MAAETIKEPILFIDGERRGLLLMKRAQSFPAPAHLPQLHIAPRQIRKVYTGLNFPNC
jgi:hypothetical protein